MLLAFFACRYRYQAYVGSIAGAFFQILTRGKEMNEKGKYFYADYATGCLIPAWPLPFTQERVRNNDIA